MTSALVRIMFATVVTAEFISSQANNAWWLNLRSFFWLILFSLFIHLLLLMGLLKGNMISATPRTALIAPISIQLQKQPVRLRSINTVTQTRQTPVGSKSLSVPVDTDMPSQEKGIVTSIGSIIPAPVQQSQAEQEESYLTHVRALIESHKFYPSAARRLGMQGVVRVSFVVNPDGSVSQVICRGGSRLLQNAAEQALRSAAPFPAQQNSSPRPLQVHYETAFALN